MERSLHGDVFAAFKRCCEEEEFELAEHLLRAIEAIAEQGADSELLDAAYALLVLPRDRPLCVRPSREKAGSK
ncbi:hypothetical protein AWB81_05060 [Caballeronia arationis]|jgi:hypothetical protein|uniref:hypothetical protein n=1 Tax=Caballeronia arationis TaxID=1777142 RepID=UPI00074D0222|nr:hypothetical protein [Caballeronia arationis]SAK92935.1 hypothetical protein AWB81_05060 [Caballeronia arationis]